MRNGIQDLFAAMGEGGCLALSIIAYCKDVFNADIDVIDALYKGIDAGIIHYNPQKPKDLMAGYVKNSIAFIKLITGKTVKEERIEVCGYEKSTVQRAINFWQLPNALAGQGHFTYGDWNSLEDSYICKSGYLKQIRRYYPI